MGAPAIYHMPSRRKSACSLASNTINGRTAPSNYEKYLKVSILNYQGVLWTEERRKRGEKKGLEHLLTWLCLREILYIYGDVGKILARMYREWREMRLLLSIIITFQVSDENNQVKENPFGGTGLFGRPFSSLHVPRNRWVRDVREL